MKTLQRFCLGLVALSAVQSLAAEDHGLTTLFYRNRSAYHITPFADEPFDQRITPTLDSFWGPSFDNKKLDDTWPGLKYSNDLLIRWVGLVQAEKTGTYTFRLAASIGGRLMIDGRLLVDALNDRSCYNMDAAVEMKAGEKKGIVVEGRSAHAVGGFRLMWKIPGATDFQVVPSSAFYPMPKVEAQVKTAAPKIETRSGFIGDRLYAVVTPPEGMYVNYTLDGSEPTRAHGALYTVPVAIVKTATLKARAFLPGGGQGDVSAQAFTVPVTPLQDGRRIFRTGNSLTGNVMTYLQDIEEAAGIRQISHMVTEAGSSSKMIWEKGLTNSPAGDAQPGPRVHERAKKIIKENAPFDYYISQPFFMYGKLTIEEEMEYAGKFYALVLAESPKADQWIYAQFGPWELPNAFTNQVWIKARKAADWREGMKTHIATCEQLRERDQAKYPAHPIRIIPCASALLALEQAMSEGKIPGMTNFPVEIYTDNIHLGYKGCYMLGLVHYACLYGKSPVGLVVPDTNLTIEQQTKMQEIAWDVVSKYPWAGKAK